MIRNPVLFIGEKALGSTSGSIFFSDSNTALAQDNSNLFWDNFSKRLGLGTSSPAYPFHLRGASAPAFWMESSDDTAPYISGNANRSLADRDLFSFGGAWNGNEVARISFRSGSDATNKDDGYMRFLTANDSSTLSERMRITQDGKIGIGNTTPASLLHISETTGAILTLGRTDTSVTASDMIGKIQFYAADVSTTTNMIVADIEAQATNTVTTDINPGRLIFRTTSTTLAATPTERMRITEAGRVGINTTSPSSTFSITDLFRVDGTTGFLGIGGAPSSTQPITITNNVTDPSTTINHITVNSTTNTITADNSNVMIGVNSALRLNAGGFNATAATGSLRGFNSATYGNGAGTITAVMGYYGQSGNLSTGTVTTAYSFYSASGQNTGGGSLGTHIAYYAANTSAATNNYGFRSQIAASANNYNLYFDGAAQNYLNGSLGVGVVTPLAKAHVVSTTEQLRLAYDATDYVSLTVNSVGALTISNTGTNSGITLTPTGTGVVTLSSGLTMTDAKDIVVGSTTGTKIATATTQKLGFYNATPIVQRSGAAQAAVVTTAATNTTPWGYSTQAQADAIITLVNELRAWAVAQGFIKGSA